MVKKLAFAMAIGAAALTTPGLARPVDNYVATLIEDGSYGAAESALTAQLRRLPANPNALLNLAFVMRHTDRMHEADALYDQVLSAPDVQVRTLSGDVVSAHDIARAGRGGTVTIALR